MALATLSVDLVAKLAKLEDGMDRASRISAKHAAEIEARWDGLEAGFKSLGVAIAGAFSAQVVVNALGSLVNQLDALNDSADATGSTVDKLSALEDVARRNGGTLDDVTGILVKFNGVLKEADGKNEVSQALKAIGLDAADLRKLDPADALQQVAVALTGFADDGNKARLVQDLLGKSIREAAPYLKDLADAGQLNATVTAEQARQAEVFNKAMARFQTEVGNAGRALTLDLLPSMTKYLRLLDALRSGPSLVDAGIEAIKGNSFKQASDGVAFYAAKLSQVEDKIASLRADNRPLVKAFGQGELDDLEKARVKLQKFVDYYKRGVEIQNAGTGQDDPRELARRGRAPALASVGEYKGAGTPPAAAPKVERPDLSIPQDLQDAIKRLEGTDTAKVQRLNDELQRLLDLQSGGSQDARLPQAIAATRDELAKLDPAARAAADAQRDLQALLDQTPDVQMDKIRAASQELGKAYDAGAISAERFAQAQAILGQRWDDLQPKAEKSADAISTWADQAQRNIQDAVGDTLLQAMDAKFSSIGQLWQQMINRMVAQALAAKLNEALFGGSGGMSGGWIGDLMNWFSHRNDQGITNNVVGSLVSLGLGGGRAYGGPVGAGGIHEITERGMPEVLGIGNRQWLLMPQRSGHVTAMTPSNGGGRQVQVTNQFTISGPVDARSQAQIAAAAAAGAQRALARNY